MNIKKKTERSLTQTPCRYVSPNRSSYCDQVLEDNSSGMTMSCHISAA
jgi:hypothetical protein